MSVKKVIHVPIVNNVNTPDTRHKDGARNVLVTKRHFEIVERLKAEGHPVVAYAVDYVPVAGSDMGFALTATLTLLCLKPNDAEAVILYKALEESFKYAKYAEHLSNTSSIWSGEAAAILNKYATQVSGTIMKSLTDERVVDKIAKPWMVREPSGFDRKQRRPQSNLPVLTIELPIGEESTGARHHIALHLEQIGYAVKFKN
ncbi:hypothetical protein KWAN_151 [Erwinia phage vB_EamM_Kwan]|uniref:Uncharacterized protein n=1 Tax=Erwinia phage vB_EamM_Kwan TaxID=1883374 RepID=A0A1B2IE21_9CAUD|nr:hypothetical protein BIZ80_gp148 [Erwinia phage vB_EamM_Kwan]ANZ49503.1 hypothetical protein KWAN_151 [Erwinia phage vB_EamM_Kwan]